MNHCPQAYGTQMPTTCFHGHVACQLLPQPTHAGLDSISSPYTYNSPLCTRALKHYSTAANTP